MKANPCVKGRPWFTVSECKGLSVAGLLKIILLERDIACGCGLGGCAEAQWAGDITDKPRACDLGQAILIGEMRLAAVLAQG